MVNGLTQVKDKGRATNGRAGPYPPRFRVSRAMTSFWISLAPS